MKLKAKAVIDGAEREVEVELPEGYLAPADISEKYVAKESVEQLVKDRLKRTRTKLRSELADDETFLQELATAKKDQLAQLLGVQKGKLDEGELERIRQQILEKDVKPLQTQVGERDKAIDRLRKKSLRGDVARAAAELNVDETLLPLVEGFFLDRVRFHEEYDDYFIAEGDDGYAVTTKPEKGKAPYRNVREELESMKESGKYGGWFKGEQRKGGGNGVTTDPVDKHTLDEQIAAAESAGKWGEANQLKAQKLENIASGKS